MKALLLPVSQFAVSAEHDLQVPRQLFFGKQFGNAAYTRSLIGRYLEQRRVFAGDLRYRDVAQESHQLAREMRRTVAFTNQFVDQHKNLVARTFGDCLHHCFKRSRRSRTDQAADRIERQVVAGRSDRLVKDRKRVTHRSVTCLGQQR